MYFLLTIIDMLALHIFKNLDCLFQLLEISYMTPALHFCLSKNLVFVKIKISSLTQSTSLSSTHKPSACTNSYQLPWHRHWASLATTKPSWPQPLIVKHLSCVRNLRFVSNNISPGFQLNSSHLLTWGWIHLIELLLGHLAIFLGSITSFIVDLYNSQIIFFGKYWSNNSWDHILMTASLNCIGNISLTLSLLMDVLKVLNMSFNKNMLHVYSKKWLD